MTDLPRRHYRGGDERIGSRWDERRDGLVSWAAWTPNDRGEGTEVSSLDAAFAISQWFREAGARDFPEVQHG